MRLLVTRPVLDAAPLAEQLAARGHDVLISPMIEIELTQAALPPVDAQGGLALTSANGVRALMARLVDDAARAAWQALPAFAVGSQTAAALNAGGFQNVHEAEGDLVALVALIKRAYKKDADILHVAGRDRAGDLQNLLGEARIGCTRAVLYRAEAAVDFSNAAEAAFKDEEEPVDGVVVYSQRSADIFCALYKQLEKAAPSTLSRPTLYCLSPSIAAAAEQAGFAARAPAKPDSAALIDLIG